MMLTDPAGLGYVPRRIICLVPSITELLYYLELDDETIAITKFCVHPAAWFKNKTRIGGTKTLQLEKIKGLSPDLIIANKEENVREQVEALSEQSAVWLTDVNSLEDSFQMISDIGLLCNRQAAAVLLVKKLRSDFKRLALSIKAKVVISTVYMIWQKPYMVAAQATFISNMLTAAGFQNACSNKMRYPEMSLEEIKKTGCQLLMLSSEPYPFKQKHVDELKKELPGVHIILVDGEIFSWYGSRMLEACEYLLHLRNHINTGTAP